MIEIADEGRQLAADLANDERPRGETDAFRASDFESGDAYVALARLATQSLADKAALADLQASYDAAVKDLAEIDRLIEGAEVSCATSRWDAIKAIAAKHRVETDPLLIEARKLVAARYPDHAMEAIEATLRGDGDNGETVQNCLAALKRGIELAKVTS